MGSFAFASIWLPEKSEDETHERGNEMKMERRSSFVFIFLFFSFCVFLQRKQYMWVSYLILEQKRKILYFS